MFSLVDPFLVLGYTVASALRGEAQILNVTDPSTVHISVWRWLVPQINYTLHKLMLKTCDTVYMHLNGLLYFYSLKTAWKRLWSGKSGALYCIAVISPSHVQCIPVLLRVWLGRCCSCQLPAMMYNCDWDKEVFWKFRLRITICKIRPLETYHKLIFDAIEYTDLNLCFNTYERKSLIDDIFANDCVKAMTGL